MTTLHNVVGGKSLPSARKTPRWARPTTRSRPGAARRPLTRQARELELLPCIDQIRFFAGAARVLNGMASAEYEAGLTSSIAAGNTVVLKPADTTLWSTVRLAELAHR